MCQHCESEDRVQPCTCTSRYIEGCSNSKNSSIQILTSDGSHLSRIVVGCEEDSLNHVTAIDIFNTSPPASSTPRAIRRRSGPRTPPVASSTFINFPETSKDSGCGKSINVTPENFGLTRVSRDRRRYSTGLFRTSTRNDLMSIDHDQRLGNSFFNTKLKEELFHGDKKRNMQKSSSVTRRVKKKLLKKFSLFNESSNRAGIYTIAYL